jgi:magnesium transporter
LSEGGDVIRPLYHKRDGYVHTTLSPKEFAAALRDRRGLLWVDFLEEEPEVCEPVLCETFGFAPLAVADAFEEEHIPKVNDWGKHLYLTLHALMFDQQDERPLQRSKLDVFLGRNYLVTHQARPISLAERVWEACRRNEAHLPRGSAYLLYKLFDEMVADYMPVVEQIDEAIDQIEDQVFDNPTPDLLERLFTLKRALLRLRRTVGPQREVLNKLARGDFDVIEEARRVFFRDVYDHLVQLHDVTESLRDLVGSALDAYLSVVNNRMNDVMKALTVITTLFMPLSFLSGFFGMNFFQPVVPLDGWTGELAFGLTLAAMVLLPVGMYLWMRRRAWM